jgi:hypothetical protein
MAGYYFSLPQIRRSNQIISLNNISVFSVVKHGIRRKTVEIMFNRFCLTTEGTESTEIHREIKLYAVLFFTFY